MTFQRGLRADTASKDRDEEGTVQVCFLYIHHLVTHSIQQQVHIFFHLPFTDVPIAENFLTPFTSLASFSSSQLLMSLVPFLHTCAVP